MIQISVQVLVVFTLLTFHGLDKFYLPLNKNGITNEHFKYTNIQ